MTRLHEHCKTRGINLWGAIAIGIGGMVGGGVFVAYEGFVIEALYLGFSKPAAG